jgi:hypothetical protein
MPWLHLVIISRLHLVIIVPWLYLAIVVIPWLNLVVLIPGLNLVLVVARISSSGIWIIVTRVYRALVICIRHNGRPVRIVCSGLIKATLILVHASAGIIVDRDIPVNLPANVVIAIIGYPVTAGSKPGTRVS